MIPNDMKPGWASARAFRQGVMIHCPMCTATEPKLNLVDIKSRNAKVGYAFDFYCNTCNFSGIIDIDGKQASVMAKKCGLSPTLFPKKAVKRHK